MHIRNIVDVRDMEGIAVLRCRIVGSLAPRRVEWANTTIAENIAKARADKI